MPTKHSTRLSILLLAAVTTGFSAVAGAAATASGAAAAASLSPDNPFAKPSQLPFELPPFDRIHDQDYAPAFKAGMALQLAEVADIARNPEPSTFDNTIVAMERSGELLNRVNLVFSNLIATNSDAALLKLETDITPKLAAHEDEIYLNSALFARVDSVYAQRDRLQLDPESRELLERYHIDFVRAGARLSAGEQRKLRRFNQQIAVLTTSFRQNVLKAGSSGAVRVDDLALLDGLSADQISSAAAAARERGLTGHWLIALQNTTTQPWLAQLKNRALRERIYRASIERARSGRYDNTGIIGRLVRARAERAHLLGYPSYAAYALEDETAHDPATAEKLLQQIGEAALRAARSDSAELQRLIDSQADAGQGPHFTLQPWDWQFYAEQLRRQHYDFDDARVKPYFELNRVIEDGVFYAAHELYGLTFRERHDLPVYEPDVRVFEVSNADGSPLALFLGDYYARDSKQGGAWMDNFVNQSKLLGQKPVVANHLNFPKPEPGAPTLLTFEDVTALFHEFGHALHGMLSDVRYPDLSGTNVPSDFVEYPSQFNEMWAREPAVVAHFARHYQTGEPLPPALLEQVIASQSFGEGYRTLEYVEAALTDLALHGTPADRLPAPDKLAAFEIGALQARGLEYQPVPPRYHFPYFLHIFSNDYAARYYSYLWSEVLARDTGAWVHAHGGLTRANGEVLRAKILSRGRSEEPQLLFKEFYGGPPDVAPMLEYRALR
jgi:peptidyl-dipeptidase Dcp